MPQCHMLVLIFFPTLFGRRAPPFGGARARGNAAGCPVATVQTSQDVTRFCPACPPLCSLSPPVAARTAPRPSTRRRPLDLAEKPPYTLMGAQLYR